MLSCCKGSLLNAEEAAPGGGEWSVDKRENNTFCWVSIPMGFSTDIYIYILAPDKTHHELQHIAAPLPCQEVPAVPSRLAWP